MPWLFSLVINSTTTNAKPKAIELGLTLTGVVGKV